MKLLIFEFMTLLLKNLVSFLFFISCGLAYLFTIVFIVTFVLHWFLPFEFAIQIGPILGVIVAVVIFGTILQFREKQRLKSL